MKNKGFTLIEIIATIIILGILMIITIPSVSKFLSDTRSSAYKSHEKSMEEAAKSYTIECIKNNEQGCYLPRDGEEVTLLLGELEDKEFLDKLQDPAHQGTYCNPEESYVKIRKLEGTDFDYTPCLYCGTYSTHNTGCFKIDVVPTTIECGTDIIGAGEAWSKEPRTISINCVDAAGSCKQDRFEKVFSTTMEYGNITIYDINSSRGTKNCRVPVRIDLEKPTCSLDVSGDLRGSYYVDDVTITMPSTNRKDIHSGIGSYGLGTGNNILTYDNRESIVLTNNGVTRVFGYVKDKVGNENICTTSVTKVGKYLINYDNNTGTGIMDDTECIFGENCTLRKNTFTKTGYHFNYWSMLASGNTAKHYADEEVVKNLTFSDTVRLYAIWEKNQNTLTVKANGGTGGFTEKHEYGYQRFINVSKLGHTFNAWSSSGTCGSYDNTASTIYTYPANNNTTCTLTAEWDINSNILVVDANGGNGGFTVTQNYNTTKAISVSRDHYVFDGWEASGTCGTYTSAASTTYRFPANKDTTCTLKAKWKKVSYLINYTLNGGSVGTNAPESGEYDSLVTIDNATKVITVTGNANGTGATVGNATRNSQIFSGWTSTTLGSNAKTGTDTNPTTGWTGTSTKNIYFKDLRDTGTVTMVANWTPVTVICPTVTKTGSTCEWYSSSTGGTKVCDSGGSYSPTSTASSSRTLYARCSSNGYSISYTLNGGSNGSNAPSSAEFDSLVTIDNAIKTISLYGNSNGTGATVGNTTRKEQTFTGWTSSTYGSNAKTGDTTNPTTGWTGTSTKNKYFLNLRESGTITMVANWNAESFSCPTVTKTGSTCEWYSSSTGGTKVCDSGGSYTPGANDSSSRMLYALCSTNGYYISYTLNGGISGPNAPTSAEYDSLVTIDNPTKTITLIGNSNGSGATIGSSTSGEQTFGAWTSTTVGSNAKAGDTTNPTASWTGTAVKYKYYKNLRESGTVKMIARWVPVAFRCPTITKTGATCAWYDSASGGTKVCDSEGYYTPGEYDSSIKYIYARCTTNGYFISYTLNGGTSGTNAPTSGEYDSVLTIDNATKTITLTGDENGTGATVGSSTSGAQTFKGWTSTTLGSSATTGTNSNPSTSWTGSSTTNKYFKNLVESGTAILEANWTPVAFRCPTVTKTGSTCAWYNRSGNSGGTKVCNSGGSYTPGANDSSTKTIYARCTTNGYSISYTLNGGSNGSNAPTSADYDSLVTIDNPTKTITLIGSANGTGATVGSSTSKTQTFKGWTSSTYGSNAKTGTSTNPTTSWTGTSTKNTYFKNLRESGTITMVANWTPVSFSCPTVTKSGNTCEWYDSASGGNFVCDSGGTYTPGASDSSSKTLYAKCETSGYSISYTLNGGSKGANAPTSGEKDALVTIDNPTKTITITGDANGSGATVGTSTSKAQTFKGWTSSTYGSNAKTGTSTNPTTKWTGTSTKNKYFKNLRDSGTITMVANWTPVSFNCPTASKTDYGCSWYDSKTGGNKICDSGGTYTPGANDSSSKTLYARCTKKEPAVIECISPYYNESSQTIAKCTGGTVGNAKRTSVGSQLVTCTGDSNHTNATSIYCEIKDAVAINQLGSNKTGYPSLQEAVKAGSYTGIAKLLKDTSENVTLDSGGSKTINLNGKTVTGSIINKGTMILNGNGTVTGKNGASTGNSLNGTVVNNNTLTVEKTTIINTSSDSMSAGLINSTGAKRLDATCSTFEGKNAVRVKNIGNKVYITKSSLSGTTNGLYVDTNDGVLLTDYKVELYGCSKINGGTNIVNNKWAYPVYIHDSTFGSTAKFDGPTFFNGLYYESDTGQTRAEVYAFGMGKPSTMNVTQNGVELTSHIYHNEKEYGGTGYLVKFYLPNSSNTTDFVSSMSFPGGIPYTIKFDWFTNYSWLGC